jgi:adenylylsulfate kinase
MACFISPFKAERAMARSLFKKDEFIEIFVDASLDICEARDPKGLYKKARSGQLKNFTGIDSAYEIPQNSEIHLNTENSNVNSLVSSILETLKAKL